MTNSDENADSEEAAHSSQPDGTRDDREDGEWTDRQPLVFGLGTAVGVFAAFGVGLVLTSFFAAQFGGTAGAGGFGAPLLGSSGGLGFAVLLSPVLAVFLGVVLGRAGATPVDGAAATAAGFAAMYLVTSVVAGSLYSPSGGPGLGPLAGFAVGVALAGALAAAVADHDLALSAGSVAVGRPAVFGVSLLAVYAVGTAVSAVLAGSLAGPTSGVGTPEGVFGAPPTRTALSFGVLFVPVVGLFAGYLGTPGDATDQSAAAGGAATGALGAVVALVVLYAAAVATGSGGSFLAGSLVGLAVGTGITGAGAGVVAART